MVQNRSYVFENTEGEKISLNLSDFHTITINFRSADNSMIVSLNGFDRFSTIPPALSSDFLIWLAMPEALKNDFLISPPEE